MSSTTHLGLPATLASTPVKRPGSDSPLKRASRPHWPWIAILALLFLALFSSFIWRMIRIATDQWGGDWSHALLIPFISLYYIFQRREDLFALPRRICWPALPLVFLGLLGYAWGLTPGPGPKDLLQGYSMILALFGLVLFLLGPAMTRVLWFPIAFLVFAVKVSDRYWLNLAEKLQFIASRSAAIMLNLLGMEVRVEGATINIYHGMQLYGALTVAEACSGLRMLAAFVAMGVAIAFLTKRSWWQRLVLVASTVPIAVLVNTVRVTIMGLLFSPENDLTKGDFHKFVGMLMLIPAIGLYLLLGWLMGWLAADDERPTQPAKPASVDEAEPVATPAGDAAAAARPRWIATGVALGVGLTALVALNYALLLAALKPGFLHDGLGRSTAAALLAGALVLLLAAAWGVTRFAHPAGEIRPGRLSSRPTPRAGTLSLGLGAGVMASALLGLQGALWANGAVLHKESVPLRQPLFVMPETLGGWKMTDDMRLSEEETEVLRTKLYINRNYRDTTARADLAGSTIRFHLAYYTGTPDTVPHVPERCFAAQGADFLKTTTTPLHLAGDQYRPSPGGDGFTAPSQIAKGEVRVPSTDLGASVFTYVEPGTRDRKSNVIYFFAANGKYLATPTDVRMSGFDLQDKYSYYCKVEIGVPGVADPVEATRRAETFLSVAMPEIMACLPDWAEVQAGRWPAK